MMKDVLLIFAKNPQYGKVKTRLAATIGDAYALFIYHELLKHTIAITKNLPVDKIVFYSEYIEEKDGWEKNIYQKKIQVGKGLGSKMKNAFKSSFTTGYEKIVIIGTDCFELDEKHILNAFEQLKKVDVVIGPAKDGGYYLLGMKKLYEAIFENVDWSTDKVLKQTLHICKQLNLSVFLLPELNDIDDEEDLKNQESLFLTLNKEA